MSCNDIPSVSDLQNTKKHMDDLGRLMGTGEGTSTNGVTGQVRPTYNKVIADMNSEFDAQIINMGFTRIGTFAAGATLTNPRQTLLWDLADGGDGQEYGWSGSFLPSGKVVPPNSTPMTTGGIAVGAWMSRFDPELRTQVRESLRRSYAEAGYNLVPGSFEAGGTLAAANDVLLQERTGKAFSGPVGAVAAGTNPASGGFTDKSIWPIATMREFNAGAYGLHPNNTGLQNCQALQALSAAVNAAVNARVVIPAGTYTLGAQTFAGGTGKGYSYKAEDALYIHHIENLELHFEGCKFVMAPDLKFGSFDPVTGAVYNPPTMPFLNYNYRAETGRFFRIQNNKNVSITGVMEFDANDGTRVRGGQWGDSGWQVWEHGLYIRENKRCVSTASIYLHKFMTDCAYFVGAIGDDALLDVSNLIAIKGGRNVVTWAGGDNGRFNHCIIGLQGQGDSAISSSPASAIDVETEISSGRSLVFNDCQFLTSENGVVANYANVYGVEFNNCDFYAERDNDVCLYWNIKGTEFNGCNFYGPLLTTSQNTNSNHKLSNTIFRDCYLTNIHKDGRMLNARSGGFGVLIASTNPATINGITYRTEFLRCRFDARIDGTEKASFAMNVSDSIIKDCTLRLSGTVVSVPTQLLVANFNGAIVDGLEVINELEREFTDTFSTMYIGINSPNAPYPVAKNANMSLKYNSSNLLTLVWGSTVQGASSGWAGRYSPATRSRFTELQAFEALALRRDRYTMSADRGYGPMYISASPGIPTSEDFIKGDVVLNTEPNGGQDFGWKCTTAGTAGSTAVFKYICKIEA